MNTEEKTVFENENTVTANETTVYETVENNTENDATQLNDEAVEEPVKSKKSWGRVAAGFGGGIVMGSLATILTASSKVPENIEDNNGEEELQSEVEVPGLIGEIQVAQNVTDDMSFNEAFAAARAEVGGGGAFVWHGNVYNTYTADEWDAMTDEQRDAYIDNFQSQATGIDTHVAQNVEPVDNGLNVIDTVPADNYNDIAQATTPEVEVIGMAQDESGALVAGIRVDGQEALIVDLDANNVADVIVSDLNGDGYISDSEIGFITDGGIYMSDLAAMQNSQDLAMGPDYVNNADTNIYEA